jgi:hypothetical protein
MYIDMDKFTGFLASSTQAMTATTPSGSEGGLTPPSQSTHHSRSVSMDGVFFGFQNNNSGFRPGGVTSDKPRARHQHSQSMDGFPSIKPELLLSTAKASLAETKKAMSAAKLADLSLIDPKRAKRLSSTYRNSMHISSLAYKKNVEVCFSVNLLFSYFFSIFQAVHICMRPHSVFSLGIQFLPSSGL